LRIKLVHVLLILQEHIREPAKKSINRAPVPQAIRTPHFYQARGGTL